MEILGLDHFQIAAPPGCEPEARRFYGGLLGLRELPKPEGVRASGGVWFECGRQELHVGIDEDFSPARKAHPGLLVEAEALEPLAQRLREAGYEVSWDERIAGVRRFFALDPWGNRLELRAQE